MLILVLSLAADLNVSDCSTVVTPACLDEAAVYASLDASVLCLRGVPAHSGTLAGVRAAARIAQNIY